MPHFRLNQTTPIFYRHGRLRVMHAAQQVEAERVQAPAQCKRRALSERDSVTHARAGSASASVDSRPPPALAAVTVSVPSPSFGLKKGELDRPLYVALFCLSY